MEKHVYQDMIEQQHIHWWYRARREIIAHTLKRHLPKKTLEILEIGCGMGGNIPMLQDFGSVWASDNTDEALGYTHKTYGIPTKKGSLPYDIPFGKTFDMICLFDVLEHVELHKEALQEIEKRLNPDGYMVVTVPAYQWLFGPHDVLNHHFRRYTRGGLLGFIQKNTSMLVVYKTYFNTLLFPLVLLTRVIDKFRKGKSSSGYNASKGLVNTLLYHIFRTERHWVSRIPFCFGTSVFLICKKTTV